jgi:lysophospholipid acyltransferase (LPLAT)-like uncharacterized protein
MGPCPMLVSTPQSIAEPLAKARNLMNIPALRWAAALLIYGYYQLVLATSSLRIRADPAAEHLVRQGVPVIYVLWHQYVSSILLLRRYARRPVAVLSSGHRDSRITAVVSRLCHLDVVLGSSTRGAVGGYRQLLRRLRGGVSICINPDGPRGPAGQLKPGVIQLARHTGCPIVPVGLAASRHRRLRSWDRTLLPLPFSRMVLELGAPLYTDAAADPLEQPALLAAALNATGRRAEEGIAAP